MRQELFPRPDSCYARDYDAAHLASHPVQRVTSLALSPDRTAVGEIYLWLWISGTIRGTGDRLEALAACEPIGAYLECSMEGDAGEFSIKPAANGAILLEVGPYGMTFEIGGDAVTFDPDRGDDRSFLLRPTAECRV
jgi:hypothetical protein